MKLIKLGLISAIVLFTIATLMGLLLPSHLTISRATDINKPKSAILPFINKAANWPTWVQGLQDPATSTLIDSTGWKMGNTEVKIVSADSAAIVTNWVLNGKNNKAVFNIIYQSENITTVQWAFEQQFGWLPWEKFSSLFAEKAIGVGMEKSLEALKKQVENPTPEN